MNKTDWNFIKINLAKLGLFISTWSPGDGITRYRFHHGIDEDYFSCQSVYTALGRKEAACFGLAYYYGKTGR